MPAYIIFTNAALDDMTAKMPETMAEFLMVSGVGEVKANRYGRKIHRREKICCDPLREILSADLPVCGKRTGRGE